MSLEGVGLPIPIVMVMLMMIVGVGDDGNEPDSDRKVVRLYEQRQKNHRKQTSHVRLHSHCSGNSGNLRGGWAKCPRGANAFTTTASEDKRASSSCLPVSQKQTIYPLPLVYT